MGLHWSYSKKTITRIILICILPAGGTQSWLFCQQTSFQSWAWHASAMLSCIPFPGDCFPVIDKRLKILCWFEELLKQNLQQTPNLISESVLICGMNQELRMLFCGYNTIPKRNLSNDDSIINTSNEQTYFFPLFLGVESIDNYSTIIHINPS